MRYFLSLFLLFALFSPIRAHGASLTDVYGDAVIAYSSTNLFNPLQASGAPDGKYADFRDKDVYLTIDMGEGEEGMGDLLLTIKVLEFGARPYVTFYDADMNVLGTAGEIFQPVSSVATVHYTGNDKYRYVKIASFEDEQWSLDAVQATQVETPTEDDVAPDTEEPTEEFIPYGFGVMGDIKAGSLIKTTENSAVYLLGDDNKRHAFPSEEVFTSWGYDFADVLTIEADEMSAITLGKNVTVRPGTWLVKVPYNPKVYAVGMGGELFWLPSEEVAEQLYGEEWASGVLDVSEAFWGNYVQGTQTEGYVNGSIIEDDGHYYLKLNDGLRHLNAEEMDLLRINYAFVLKDDAAHHDMLVESELNSDLVDFYQPY